MLEKEEIKRIAEIKGLSIQNAEKDYLLEVTLFNLYKEVGNVLAFKGGTSLFKLYSLNRFSDDLDFTLVSHKIKVDKLFTKVIKNLSSIGIEGKIREIDEYRSQKNIKLELRGPLFDGNPKNISFVNINISLKEKPLYDLEQRKIFSQYADIPAFDAFVMKLDELFAEKVRALLTRDKARDAYDVWFLLNKGVNINVKDINKKLKLYGGVFSEEVFVEKINGIEKYWEADLKDIMIGDLPEFSKIKKDIISILNLRRQTSNKKTSKNH